MPLSVIGYHGCHVDAANLIVAGTKFRPSENGYDWLGAGIYFWEDAPSRAAEWARKRFGDSGAVLEAMISLGHCLNLLDTTHFDKMAESHQKLLTGYKRRGLDLPKNVRKRHDLDYVVIEAYSASFVDAGGNPFQTVRGCFPEGAPLYDGSKILRETHIQIAVRDHRYISEVAVVNYT
ncbi:MAG: hypothetical protein ACLQVD_07240 [Capsulimonadaceae bacterium]